MEHFYVIYALMGEAFCPQISEVHLRDAGSIGLERP